MSDTLTNENISLYLGDKLSSYGQVLAEKELRQKRQLKINTENDKNQPDKQREMIRHAALVAKMGARLYGQGDLAELFGDIGDVAEAGDDFDEDGRPGTLRKLGSNLAGSKASKVAQKRGISGGRSAALGGALSSALQGEGITGMMKGSVSWYLLYIAFGSLFTVVGSIPAVLYLDFHYVMSKFGSKIFGEMFLWQKFVLLFFNIALVFLILSVLGFIVMIFGWTSHPIDAIKNLGWGSVITLVNLFKDL